MHDKRTYEITFDGHRPPLTVAAPASPLDLAAHAITHLVDAGAVQASVALTAGRVTVTDATGTVVATGALTGPGVGPAELPDLGAVTDLLTAGGWTLDYTDDIGGAEECGYLHPTGREVIATPRLGGLVDLHLTGLDLAQATGALAGAGLAPPAAPSPDLSVEGVNQILAALDAAGVKVHYHETDGDHYIDLHLTPIDADDRMVLCWYADRQGWRVNESDPSGTQVHCYPIGHVDLAAVVAETTSILAAEPTPAEPDTTPGLTVPQRLADELHRIADAIATRRMPVGTTVHLRVGVLDSRADLETLAAYLGSEIHEDGGRLGDAIPYTQHVVQLSGRERGPRLEIHGQIQPERSEVERLRARVAELEAQQGGGAR